MKSIKWIERLIEEKKLPSDNQAAIMLGMTRQGISHHRSGNITTLKDETAYKLEELLEMPHGKIVADQHAEREKNPEIRKMWEKLASVAASIFLVMALGITGNNQAKAGDFLNNSYSVVENPRVGGSIPPRGTM